MSVVPLKEKGWRSLKPVWLIESLQNPFQSQVEVGRWNSTDSSSEDHTDFRGLGLLVQSLNQSPTKSIENLSLVLMRLYAELTSEMLVKSLKFLTKFLWLVVIWTFTSAIPNAIVFFLSNALLLFLGSFWTVLLWERNSERKVYQEPYFCAWHSQMVRKITSARRMH